MRRFAILRAAKLKTTVKIRSTSGHNLRRIEVENADPKRAAENLFARFDGGGRVAWVRSADGLPNLDELVEQREGDTVGVRPDGSTFPVATERHATFLHSRRLFVETVHDVTEQRRTEAHLTGLAYHDALTQLPNRLLFDDRLRMEMARARRHGQQLAVLFIDLDRFKGVNDVHGHEMGDLLLKKVAQRLRDCVRESDTVSRRGGDEFTVILGDVHGADDAARVAQSIVAQMDAPFHIQNVSLHIGASVGICLYPTQARDVNSLLAGADEAMYRAKMMGRGTYCFHERDED